MSVVTQSQLLHPDTEYGGNFDDNQSMGIPKLSTADFRSQGHSSGLRTGSEIDPQPAARGNKLQFESADLNPTASVRVSLDKKKGDDSSDN